METKASVFMRNGENVLRFQVKNTFFMKMNLKDVLSSDEEKQCRCIV